MIIIGVQYICNFIIEFRTVMLDMMLLDAVDLMSLLILCREEDDEEISNDRPLSWGFVPDRPPDFQLEGRRHPPLLGLQRCAIDLSWLTNSALV
jgi:hypothetical protein